MGDLVQADLRDDRAIIERVLPRHSLLVRRMAGGEGEQVIAANLDGGSSSTLYYNGKVINKPADLLGERMIPTAFVVK